MLFTTAKTKSLGLVGIFMFLLGSTFLIISGYVGLGTKQKIDAFAKTSGVVSEVVSYRSDGSTLYKPVISFDDVNGKTLFSPNTGSNPASHSVGDAVEVYYDPSGVEEPMLNHWTEIWLFPGIFGVLGGTAALIGGYLTHTQLKKERELAWLVTNGQLIETTYSGTRLNTSYKVNNKSPYIIESQWVNPANGAVVVFESDYLWFNPEQFLTPRQIISVKIDPLSPETTYSMDSSFLPKK